MIRMIALSTDRCGIWAATHIIQRSGCTLPDVMDFKA